MRATTHRPLAAREQSVRQPATTPRSRWGRSVWCSLIVLFVLPAFAGAPRDIVFECPCQAEWVPGDTDGAGNLTLHFGVRSHRATESGDIRLAPASLGRDARSFAFQGLPAEWAFVGQVAPNAVIARRTRSLTFERPPPDTPIQIYLYERTAEGAATSERRWDDQWHGHEGLVLWPVPGETGSGSMSFVDILTDSDADGVGDVNERLAGTDPSMAADTPGISAVDVLALYDAEVLAEYGDGLFTRMHHILVLTDAVYADSGTNIRLRRVGMTQIVRNEHGRPEDLDAAMDAAGADLPLQFFRHSTENSPCPPLAACGHLGSALNRGLWSGGWAAVTAFSISATVPAHELGHAFGLVHSSRQGETYGAFRWSRGHYILGATGRSTERGTVMTYAQADVRRVLFSDPDRDCAGPCGVEAKQPHGADAVASLDLVRFQVAAQRAPKTDSDGDGFVDPVDALPDDANEWRDTDGDGLGDVADMDDDDDGVADSEDPFPLDPTEWADADGDGIGDNADGEVVDLGPFRDPALRAAVEEALGKSPGESIAEEDLLALTVLDGNDRDIHDLAGLQLAANLENLELNNNAIRDLSPLSELDGLRSLKANRNAIGDLSALADLEDLEFLHIALNGITDLSPLSGMTGLRVLGVSGNGVADLAPLSALSGLETLSLSGNPVTDLSPLSELAGLRSLSLNRAPVVDLSPLRGLDLTGLDVSATGVTFDAVRALPYFSGFRSLGLGRLGIADVSVFAELDRLKWLWLGHNLISDLASLSELSGVHWLSLQANEISDLGPLLQRSFWADEGYRYLRLSSNPLTATAVSEQIPLLRSWGIDVHFDEIDPGVVVAIPDTTLRKLVAQAVSGTGVFVDAPVTEQSIAYLRELRAFGAGVSDLTGLEVAAQLRLVHLGSNGISDVTPLADLGQLTGVDLSDNHVADIAPLVGGTALGRGDWINLNGNPLNEESVNSHIPALRERGVDVRLDSVRLLVPPDTRGRTFDLSGYFEATVGAGAELAVVSDAPDGVEAELEDGRLQVSLGAVVGPTSVNVTATNSNGTTETLAFEVSIRQVVALFPSAATTAYQGFVRVTNHSAKQGRAVIHATDDEGQRHGPVTLSLDAHATAPFNSQDLEHGNAAKGLSDGVGAGTGDWRLDFGSNLDIEVLGYARTAEGFVTTLHELAPRTGDDRTLPFLNPGSNTAQVSRLRLVNTGAEDAEVGVTGVDDRGRSPGAAARFGVAAGTARTLTAAELEAGEGATGSLGDGAGKWRLVVASPDPVYAMSLLESPTGHLTNLSSGPVRATEGTHTVPLFPAAGDPDGRQGFVRVVNRADRAGTVTIAAIDDAGQHHGSATLALSTGATAPFNSNDLEHGNPDKGLTDGVGAGTGDWRLSLTADVAVDVFAYVRHADGFVTSMHDAAPGPAAPVAGAPVRDTHHRIGFLNPGSNRAQVSSLRLINPGTAAAEVTITGRDDGGRSPGDTVRVTVPAGAARTYTAAQLEEGGTGLRGALGDGAGKWRLTVDSNEPILVMSLLASPTGHLSNLSTAPLR